MATLADVVWAVLIFMWRVFGAFFFLNFLKLSGLLDGITAAISAVTGDTAIKAVVIMFSFAMFLGAVAAAGSPSL